MEICGSVLKEGLLRFDADAPVLHRLDGVGAKDVAYMFTCHWYPERRYVLSFLKHYHAALQALGISDYRWETFWLDYRVAVINYLMDTPRLCAAGVNPEVWWPIYERGLVAFYDLGCDQVLNSLS